MAWQQISIRLDADRAERTEALLRLAGAEAVSISDAGDDPVLEPAPGSTPLWPSVRLTALFPAATDMTALRRLLGEPDPAAIETTPIDERDWIDAWRQSIRPLRVDRRLEILPVENAAAAPVMPRVVLSMGLAFGTGQHPTTRLCLEWLACRDWAGTEVLDFGCGSGVLALAALRLGARFAYVTDNDDQALIAARENARLNGLEDAVWVGRPAALPARKVDLLVANILAGTLCELADDFAARQEPGGRLLLSGILDAQVDAVVARYQHHYTDFEAGSSGGWSRLAAVRRRFRPDVNADVAAPG